MECEYLLKILLASTVSVPALLAACGKEKATPSTATGTSDGNCTVAPTETEGPFPTHTPSSYVRADITDGKTGYKLMGNITITRSSAGCTALAGALVDTWYCDAEGNYSEYGGTGMQSTNYTSLHFLRGRPTTDSAGLVTFTSIFPSWYFGPRRPHPCARLQRQWHVSEGNPDCLSRGRRHGAGPGKRLRQGPEWLHLQ